MRRGITENHLSRIRLKDVALKADVSTMSVSAALTGRGRISTRRAEYIRRIAQEMGYRTNAAAQILRRKKSGGMGLVIMETAELVRANTSLSGITIQFSEACRSFGVRPQIEWFDYRAHPDQLPEMFTNGLVDGLLIWGYGSKRTNERLKRELSLPFVRLLEPGDFSVYHDVCAEMHDMLDYLIRHGHRRIALVNGPAASGFHVFASAKKEFLAAPESLPLQTEDLFYHEAASFGVMEIHALADELLHWRPTAVVMHNASRAKSLICELVSRGIAVPGDISFLCYGAEDFDCDFNIPLTFLDDNVRHIVASGIKLLRERMENPGAQRASILVHSEIQEGASVQNLSRDG